MAYSKAEQREYFQRVIKPRRQAAARESRLAALHALLRVARDRNNDDPCWENRLEVERLQNAIDELIAGPELERLRAVPHPDPLLASHAPEVPAAERVGRPIWSVMRELYWTARRRRLYRGAM